MPLVIRRLAGVALVVCALLGGCTASSPASGLVKALQKDSEQFQAPTGLFTLPESVAADSFDYLQSAELRESVAWASTVPSLAQSAPLEEPGEDLAEIRALAVLHRQRDPNWKASAAWVEKFARIGIPEPQSDLGAEVAALWLWSDTRARVAPDAVVPPEVTRRIDALDPATLESHPYLAHRAMQIMAKLGAEPSADLNRALRVSQSGKFPDPGQVNAIWDAKAFVERGRKPAPDLVASWGEHLREMLDDQDLPPTDRAVIAEVAHLLGIPSVSQLALGQVIEVLDKETGLIKRSPPPPSVDATYVFARILGPHFADVASAETIARLKEAATGGDPVTRVRAVSSIKAAGQSWLHLVPPLEGFAAAMPTVVRAQDVPTYLDLAEGLRTLDIEFELATLDPAAFGVFAEESPMAVAILQLSDLFRNRDEVRAAASGWVKQLKSWASDTKLPLEQQVSAMATLATLPGALTADELSAFGAHLDMLRGCQGTAAFIPATTASGSACSARNTLLSTYLPSRVGE